jgi:hypothetical protein
MELPKYDIKDSNYLIATSYPSPQYSLIETKYSKLETIGIVLSLVMLIVALTVHRNLLWHSLLTFLIVKFVFQLLKLAKDKDTIDRQDVKRFSQFCMYGVLVILLYKTKYEL